MSTTRPAELRLTDAHLVMRPGGTVTYRAAVEREPGDMTGAWVGWIGDATDSDGTRRWWAEWRENGDPGPRWDSGPVFDTLADAHTALTDRRS